MNLFSSRIKTAQPALEPETIEILTRIKAIAVKPRRTQTGGLFSRRWEKSQLGTTGASAILPGQSVWRLEWSTPVLIPIPLPELVKITNENGSAVFRMSGRVIDIDFRRS